MCSAASVIHLHMLKWPPLLPTEPCGVGTWIPYVHARLGSNIASLAERIYKLLLIAMASPCVCRYRRAQLCLFACNQSVTTNARERQAMRFVQRGRAGQVEMPTSSRACMSSSTRSISAGNALERSRPRSSSDAAP